LLYKTFYKFLIEISKFWTFFEKKIFNIGGFLTPMFENVVLLKY